MTTVDDLFDAAGIARMGVVRWGERVPIKEPGVYVVATSHDAGDGRGFSSLPLSTAALSELLRRRPEISIDGRPANGDTLSARLRAMFPINEPVLYVGLTQKSLSRRTWDYYTTPLGARKPHAGGWPIQLLDDGVELWVHYGVTRDSVEAEKAMVQRFAAGVADHVRAALIDPARPLPFANLTEPGGARKRHGIRGATEKKKSRSSGDAEVSEGRAGQDFTGGTKGNQVNGEALVRRVMDAIAEFDRIGQSAFLSKYGWGKSSAYVLVVDGKHYDSKAILGVAKGIGPGPSEARRKLSGGKNGAAKELRSLGFEVIEVREMPARSVPTRGGHSQTCDSCYMLLPTSGVCSCG